LLTIARAEELDAVVVDDGLAEETYDDYRREGVNLVRAERSLRSVSTTT
jgi:hypothetical protein